MTTLIIARHGNTFGPNDIPTRVGARTDLPLVQKGLEQAAALGQYLKKNEIFPDVVYSSTLQRTKETAKIALKEAGVRNPVYALDIFNEVDYGPDENKPEEDVIARIGQKAMDDWESSGIVPDGWSADSETIIQNWRGFAQDITKTHDTITNQVLDLNETILVVTSNGIARFAPHITDDFASFKESHALKLSTGAFGIMEFKDETWFVKDWNIRPPL